MNVRCIEKYVSSRYHGVYIRIPENDKEWEELKDLRSKTKALLKVHGLIEEYFGDWDVSGSAG